MTNMSAQLSQASLPSCHEALSEILQPFQDRDIRNFLFTPERIEGASFSDPNAANISVAASLSSTRYYGQTVEHVEGHILYIPAFTAANRHLGFGYNRHYTSGSSTNATGKRSRARYVLDNAQRTFLTVLSGEDGRDIITYKRFISTTCHKRFTVCFDGRVEGGADKEAWISGVRSVYAGLEFRECVYCQLARCDCRFVEKVPEHPFDDTGFREAVSSMMGRFTGFGRVEMYAGGRVAHATLVGCEMRVGVCTDAKVVNELLGLAGAVGRVGEQDSKRIVSELKAELRRERNRASARKSNLKKKLLNDGLKTAVREERRRVAMLRDKEKKLRLRNLELRRMLAEREAMETREA